MWQIFLEPNNLPFSVALTILGLLLVIEVIGLFFGGALQFLDGLLPDGLVDGDFTINEPSLGLRFLDWLYFGKIPTAILLIVWLACFSLVGFLIQGLAVHILGNPLSIWLASVDALAISLPLLHLFARLLQPIIPKDETTAISDKDLIGLTATIVLGQASLGKPAQAKVVDRFSQVHYVMVEPEIDSVLTGGVPLKIVGQQGIVYLVRPMS